MTYSLKYECEYCERAMGNMNDLQQRFDATTVMSQSGQFWDFLEA